MVSVVAMGCAVAVVAMGLKWVLWLRGQEGLTGRLKTHTNTFTPAFPETVRCVCVCVCIRA